MALAQITPISNPFSTRFVRPGTLPYQFPDGITAPILVNRLVENGWWGQIIGSHGTGKSTLLHGLLKPLADARRVVFLPLGSHRRPTPLAQGTSAIETTLPCDCPRGTEAKVKIVSWASFNRSDWKTLDPQTLLVVDGYEQLSGLRKRRLERRCRHQRCGLLVTAHANVGLPTILETTTSPGCVQQLVKLLLAEAEFQIGTSQVAEAFDRCGGNVRETFFLLYDLYQSRRLRRS